MELTGDSLISIHARFLCSLGLSRKCRIKSQPGRRERQRDVSDGDTHRWECVLVEAETSLGSRDLYIVSEQSPAWQRLGLICTFKVLHLGVEACSHGNSHDADDDDGDFSC